MNITDLGFLGRLLMIQATKEAEVSGCSVVVDDRIYSNPDSSQMRYRTPEDSSAKTRIYQLVINDDLEIVATLKGIS